MAEITKYEPGEFCWTDLGTTDVTAAKRFYKELFGWSYRDMPMEGGGGVYSICELKGKSVCAMYTMMKEQRDAKMPPNWLPFIAVDNVDSYATKAKTSGAKILAPPGDAMDAGRFSILQDPTGGIVGLWQAGKHIGAGVGGDPGSVCWRELTTPNIDISAKFYSTVFGWKGSAREMGGGMTYHMFALGEDGVAGMMLPPKKDIPPHWLTYWVVEHCDATVQQAKKLGAQVYMPSTAIPGMGRFAVLADPQGATFGVFEPTEQN